MERYMHHTLREMNNSSYKEVDENVLIIETIKNRKRESKCSYPCVANR